MKLVFEMTVRGQARVAVEQHSPRTGGLFKLSYGRDSYDNLSEELAADLMGKCLMNAIKLAGRIDDPMFDHWNRRGRARRENDSRHERVAAEA